MFDFPDLKTAAEALLSAGGLVAAERQAGVQAVRAAVLDSLAAFRTEAGRYSQRNRFRYVVAEA